jgi:hypothetical protein
MYVKIGSYKDYLNSYSVMRWIFAWTKDSDGEYPEWVYNYADKLSFLDKILSFIEGKRKIKVRIDPYDTWSMDHTLALIIHPMLVQLKETSHGSPIVDDEDVSEDVKDKDTHERWNYVLDEMIFAFDYIKNETYEGSIKEDERTQVGLKLFGKYFRALWD